MAKEKLVLEVPSDCDEIDYENINEEIAQILAKRNPDGYFYCQVKNFGWRKVSGHAFCKLHNGIDIVSQVLPNTPCTFKIYLAGKKIIKIQNFHHDSPCGDEWYTLIPISQRQFENKTPPKSIPE